MTCHQHPFVPSGTWFFSLRLADPRSDLLVREVGLLRHVVSLAMKRRPFVIEAAVVLPAQLHMIWTLPEGDTDYPARWRMIKSGFSAHMPTPQHLADRPDARGGKGIWQRRFWDYQIRDAADLARHRRMIVEAPVLAGLAARPQDWALSSVHRDLRSGGDRTLTTQAADVLSHC